MAEKHSQTNKEACFEAAVTALQALRVSHGKSSPEILHQRAWSQAASGPQAGTWRLEPPDTNIWQLINRLGRWIRGDPVPPDHWPGGQFRYPDTTVVRPDGKMVVVDLKFDRADGTRDQWRTAKGAGNNKTQREDYNQINRQQTGVSDLDLSIDADVCKCPPGKPQRVNDTDANFAEAYVAPFVERSKQRNDDARPGDPPSPPQPQPPQELPDRTPEVEEDLDDLDEEEAPELPEDPYEPDWGPQPVLPGPTPHPWGAPGGAPVPVRPMPVRPSIPLRPIFGIP